VQYSPFYHERDVSPFAQINTAFNQWLGGVYLAGTVYLFSPTSSTARRLLASRPRQRRLVSKRSGLCGC
jgi:hypothetical protein